MRHLTGLLLFAILSLTVSANPKTVVRTNEDVKESLKNKANSISGNDAAVGMGISGLQRDLPIIGPDDDDVDRFPGLPGGGGDDGDGEDGGDGGDGGDGDDGDDGVDIDIELFVLNTKLLNNGKTTGKIMTSHQGRNIYSFQGIRYMETPDRFEKTHSPSVQTDTDLDATSMGSECLQASKFNIDGNPIAVGEEDCFFLNVYTPADPSTLEALLPVIVFIHGGQFVQGDASPYLPIRLLDEDVLLVTFHYRLGALSFYSYGGQGTFPGNLALYDQIVALKWVNKYIEDFGGDKNRVTLVGQDAGATSALYLLLADKSVDVDEDGKDITLFTAVVAQSGSPIDPFGLDLDGDQTSADLETLLECDDSNSDERAACMIKASTDDLALGAYRLAENQDITVSMMAPRIEAAGGGIVKKAPLELLKDGAYKKLPLLLGTCAQEGSYIFGKLYSHYLAPTNKVDDTEYLEYRMVPDLVELAGINDPLEFVAASLYETYLKGVDRTVYDDTIPGMIDMTGALFSKAGMLETAKLSYENYLETGGIGGGQDKSVADIFLYSFEYKGEDSSFPFLFWGDDTKPEFTTEQIGVTHGDDLLYLLKLSSLANKDDENTMLSMTEMWAKFAIEHNPTPTGGVGSGVQWKPYSNENQEYLSIGKDIEAKEGYEDRYTILVDEEKGGDWNRPTSIILPTWPDNNSTFTYPTFPTTDHDNQCSCEELEEVKDERVAYMVTMIVFIIMFVLVLGFAIYSYSKSH